MTLLGDRIIEQAAHIDAAMQRLLADIRAFDASGAWAHEGMQSCAHWLSWRVGWGLAMARDRVRVARGLGEFPATEACLGRGELSYSRVRAVLRVATPENENMLLQVARLTTADQLETVARKYAGVQAHDKNGNPRDDSERRHIRCRATSDGMIKIEATLHPEEAEIVWAMLDHAAKQLTREVNDPRTDNAVTAVTDPAAAAAIEPAMNRAGNAVTAVTDPDVAAATDSVAEPAMNAPRTGNAVTAVTDPDMVTTGRSEPASEPAINASRIGNAVTAVTDPDVAAAAVPAGPEEPTSNTAVTAVSHARFNRADALVMIAQTYLRGDKVNRSPVDVTVTIPMSALHKDAETSDVGCVGESAIDVETARRLSCDAGMVEVTENEQGTPLSVGRRRRTISGSIKRALLKRDSACTFPGCTNHVFLEGHHIHHWADGGATSLDNLVVLCSYHHRFVHEYGYTIELSGDGQSQFRDPAGRLVVAVPERAAPADLGWAAIRAANAELRIDASTTPCWDGTPVSYRRVIGHLAFADRLA